MSVWLPSAPCTPGACVERAGSLTALPRAVLRFTAVVALMLVAIGLLPRGGGVPPQRVRRGVPTR
ncbi:1-acyl-sn-glycerol-3-phosphate acyltransferase, partial [Streptomyces sp. NPDC059627]